MLVLDDYEMYLLAFLASFLYIGLKSFQQSNVTNRKYTWILPTSLCMCVLEIYTIALMSRKGLGILVFVIGFGGGLGSICATYLHHKMTKE